MPESRILITGAKGFIGRNLCATLTQVRPHLGIIAIDMDDSSEVLAQGILAADFIVHLAGVNRPKHSDEFTTGNAELTRFIVKFLAAHGRKTPIILSSSIQASNTNPYGTSKHQAEEAVFEYGRETGAPVYVYRLPNVFGKWCRPNYNSAVATFCHNIARDFPIQVNDPTAPLNLVHIDDVIAQFLAALDGQPHRQNEYCVVPEVYSTTVGDLAATLHSFRDSRRSLAVPDQADPLVRRLYGTYLSHLPSDEFSYPLIMHKDARGSFTEFIRTPERGQLSVNISRPGITKGNHWHHSKNEKFLVVSGHGVIRFRRPGEAEVIEYFVSGEELRVVDIPPGYIHNISNLGNQDMVTLMWVNEPFNRQHPDTWAENV